MAKRIGERLVEKGLLTREQLIKALKYQLMVGGHLGTSLIELGYVDELALGKTLAECLQMRYASPAQLSKIPKSAIEALGAHLVEKHHVVPLMLCGRTLHLAVISPRDLASLSQITGLKIIPWLAPEIRILEAMERYYDIPRRPRYVTLSHGKTGGFPSSPEQRAAGLSPTEQAALHLSLPAPHAQPAVLAHPSAAREESAPVAQEGPAPPAGPSVTAESRPATTAPATADVVTPTPVAGVEPVRPRPPVQPESAVEPNAPVWSFDEVSVLMSHADSREELTGLVLAYTRRTMPVSIIFGVKGAQAYIWDSHGLPLTDQRSAELSFPVASGSVFELLLGLGHYHGAVPDTAACRRFYAQLKRRVPRDVLLLPVYVNDQLVSIVYGESDRRIEGDIGEYRELARKISLALSMIILKMKIRAG